MTTVSTNRIIRNYTRGAQCAGIVAIATGTLTLVGWFAHADMFKSIIPGAASMKPITALCCILSGISLLLLCRSEPGARGSVWFKIARVCAAIVATVGLISLGEYMFATNTGIENLLFTGALNVTGSAHAGRTPSAAALAFTLLGTALFFIDTKFRGNRFPAQLLAMAIILIGLIASLGYAYDIQDLYQFFAFSSMAIHTALSLVALGVGVLFSRPNVGLMAAITSENLGGMLARKMLPAAIILPFVIGWLRLAGERAGLYGTAVGIALFATSSILIFVILIWLSARSMNRVDRERKHAEEELRTRERRFRALIEHSVDGIVLVNATGTILYASPSVEAIEGYTPDELIGRNAVADIHPDDIPALQEQFENVLATPGVPFMARWRRRRRDGQWIWLEGFATNLLDDPSVAAIVNNFRDITGHKRAEEAHRESEERFSKVFQFSPAGMALLRMSDLMYVDANESWLAMIGYTRDEVVGHTAIEVRVTEADDRTDRIERIRAAGRTYDEDVTLRTKQGEIRNCLVSAQVITMYSEPYLIGVYLDVTERRRAQAERMRLETQLLQSQKMEALGTLASGIAHDFNNILTAIVGNTRLARADLPADHPIQRSLNDVYNAGVRASELVRRILAFGRQQEPNRRALKLGPVVNEAVELLHATLPARIEVRASISAGLPDIEADPTQIHQVLMNLGTNAAHAMGDQAGRIDMRLETVTVDADIARTNADLHEGKYVRLSVSDNGCGMEPALVQRIFEPFFTTKGPGQGTGLGLSVVHGIVQSHDGAMTVYSEPGRGTTFNIYFPISLQAAGTEESTPATDVGGHGERLLYVDDEPALVTLFTMILERAGYTVTGQRDPVQALELFQSRPHDFDLVITDLSMPGMSGPELARRILAIRPEIPVMLMSGYMPDFEVESARNIGVRGFVTKPTTADSLQQALHTLLREHKGRGG